VVCGVLLCQNIVIDAETAQLVAAAVQEPGMRLYGRDASGRYYQVHQTDGGRYREAPRGIPTKPIVKLLLPLAVIIVIIVIVSFI